jgi:hypothetical protein
MSSVVSATLLAGLQPYLKEASSKIKSLVREAEARTREALVEAIGRAISAVSAQDARGFFEHCGYGIPAQSLW